MIINTGKAKGEGFILTLFETKVIADIKPITVELFPFVTLP